MSDKQEIDITNKFLVGSGGGGVKIFNPPHQMTADEAMVFAAWIVAIASMNSSQPFQTFYDKVCAT
jgi:hypothetical protein